jgi:hypothetical protein
MAGDCHTVTLHATEQQEAKISHHEVHNSHSKYDKFETYEDSLYPILATWE